MNGESALKASALQPPPSICFNRNYTRVVDTIETSGKMPARNPTDKVHYIVRFRDWRLTHSVTLALDVPKRKWVLSGRVNSIIDVCWHSSLPSPFRAYPKENPVLLGREYLNRTNRPVDIFASEQNN
ncbi:ORF126 (chloroplast) [Jatropha curcas]|uniref:ORF126 n=1 Tax=Jatropha curcas TaxID=180498 RepID=C0LEB8_JATCU|nr:ORF126 [Jatropha curcas]YP_002720173.1 ORF126 [Jatropha curcas]ACN72735.1 ORF126 [Jatropha curcas]ACN72751.1 ORF126 [Jatropha curcas]